MQNYICLIEIKNRVTNNSTGMLPVLVDDKPAVFQANDAIEAMEIFLPNLKSLVEYTDLYIVKILIAKEIE